MDRVLVNDLALDQLTLSPAPWKTAAPQPAFLTVTVFTDTSKAGATDDLQYSVSYADIAKRLRADLSREKQQENQKTTPAVASSSSSSSKSSALGSTTKESSNSKPTYFNAQSLAEKAAQIVLFHLDPPLPSTNDSVQVQARLPDALLHGGTLCATVKRSRKDYNFSSQTPSSASAAGLGATSNIELRSDSPNLRLDSLRISDFTVSTILGLRDHERVREQPLVIEVETWPNHEGYLPSDSMSWCAKTLQETIRRHALANHPLLLEKYCPDMAHEVISTCKVPKVRVRLDKPKAVMWTSTTAVETIRYRSFFQQPLNSSSSIASTSRSFSSASASKLKLSSVASSTAPTLSQSEHVLGHTAYIAIGSNVGNKTAHISKALRLLDDPRRLYAATPSASPILRPADGSDVTGQRFSQLLNTSFLYESEPMYVVEQDRFLNGVCKIRTSLSPQQLLAFLKSIEKHIGRRKTIVKGPREIDLDLLLYDDDLILRDNDVDLTVPHPLIAEREFVLRPLNDIAAGVSHPILKTEIKQLLNNLSNHPTQLRQVTPLAARLSTFSVSPTSRTLIMSIINTTPDSFSDGGQHFSVDSAVQAAKEHTEQGADILDIGGVSTRPGSAHVTEEDELQRVIPVIRAIRDAGISVPISVDTYRASVARESINAGADIINDISGGMYDPDMLETVADLDVPFVLMHMRGAPEEVNQARHQAYEDGDVVSGVRKELAEAVRKALNAGIKRWNIILDPGIGFSKNVQGNLQLLRNLQDVTGRTSSLAPLFANGEASGNLYTQETPDIDAQLLSHFPVLVGVSRKGFLGKITSQSDPTKREYANSAVHALAIANGANILRVHDVRAASDAAKVADAIYGKVL